MGHWKLIVGGIVAIVLVVGVAASLTLTGSLGETAAGDVRQGPADHPAARVDVQDNQFAPTTVSVAAGSPVQIELRNDGKVSHNFTSEALHVSTGPMQPGDVTTVSVSVPKGTTEFLCTWHQGMVISVVGT